MIYDCSKVNPTEATTVPKDDSPQEKTSDGRKRQKVNPTEATTVPKDDSPQEKASDGRKRQKEKNERAKRSSDQTKEKNKNNG